MYLYGWLRLAVDTAAYTITGMAQKCIKEHTLLRTFFILNQAAIKFRQITGELLPLSGQQNTDY